MNVVTQNTDLFSIGQIVHFEAPINELAIDYMVKQKETQILSVGDFSNVFYTYKLVSNFNSENAINYFDNQRAKANGNIGEGETILRNVDIENNFNIVFYGFNKIDSGIVVQGDNILDCALDSPFID